MLSLIRGTGGGERARAARPLPARPWRDGPTPMSVDELAALTASAADALAAGRVDVRRSVPGSEGILLSRDRHVDVWLMEWTGTPFCELHDHGGSLGALTVLEGEVVEWHWSPGPPGPAATAEEAFAGGPGPTRRVLAEGDSAAFPLGHVHDVSSRLPGARSVHAYSPPLSALAYYERGAGSLWRSRTELVVAGSPAADEPGEPFGAAA